MDDLMRRIDDDFARRIGDQPGFVSYEALDCGDGEITTISVFRQREQAEGSRELAQRWSEENLGDFEFSRIEALSGEILVSRAAERWLEPAHERGMAFTSIRRYRLRTGEVDDLMHVVDEKFAERMAALDGFEAYHAVDCGGGELIAISVFNTQEQAEESDDLALDFVREDLGGFELERTEAFGGEVLVSRAMAEVLEPAHA
jgi:hypothetical protein